MTLQVVFSRAARKTLRRLPADRRGQIVTHIAAAAAGDTSAIDVRRLVGSDLRRLRVGDWRVLFSIDVANQLLKVELIRTRGDVYNR